MISARLSQEQRDRIYEGRIRPDVLAGAAPSRTPAAMIVAGQPGAGMPFAAATLRLELAKTIGAVVQLSDDRLRAYHPAWRPGAGAGLLSAPALGAGGRLLVESHRPGRAAGPHAPSGRG